ncbi:uncharacterized protein LOC142352265 isoform X4 [Convolutriloba macropyga]|uniref:uncharacterized protein LOC142352265 isoform X4 n=1 Tax=Convolutriloba macropyga TaxID=536237 RepID=UPI003F52042E
MLKFNFVRFGSICLSAVMCTASESERVSTDEKSDKDTDPCSDEPCGEKGECSDLGNGFAYACQCERGWVDDENYQQPNCKLSRQKISRSSDRTEKRYETPASTLEEERSLLSPQMSPRPILRNGPFPTPPSAASVQPVRTMQMGAPALSFQSN